MRLNIWISIQIALSYDFAWCNVYFMNEQNYRLKSTVQVPQNVLNYSVGVLLITYLHPCVQSSTYKSNFSHLLLFPSLTLCDFLCRKLFHCSLRQILPQMDK